MATHPHNLALTDESLFTPPLSSEEEQARILRAATMREPNNRPLHLDEAFHLEPWETRLLHNKAHSTQRLQGLAHTLLRARAAEWAVTRRLALSTTIDLDSTHAICSLLDRSILDLRAATDDATGDTLDGFEQIADRLGSLYRSVTDIRLRLLRSNTSQLPTLNWVVKATADATEQAEASRKPGEPSLDDLLAPRETPHVRLSAAQR